MTRKKVIDFRNGDIHSICVSINSKATVLLAEFGYIKKSALVTSVLPSAKSVEEGFLLSLANRVKQGELSFDDAVLRFAGFLSKYCWHLPSMKHQKSLTRELKDKNSFFGKSVDSVSKTKRNTERKK